jgi:glycogen synthase
MLPLENSLHKVSNQKILVISLVVSFIFLFFILFITYNTKLTHKNIIEKNNSGLKINQPMIIHVTRNNPTNYPYSSHINDVTSLAKSQLSKNFDVSIILPKYSNSEFFKNEEKITEIPFGLNEIIPVFMMKYGELKFYRIGSGSTMPLDTIWDSKEKNFKEKSLREVFFSLCVTQLILQIYLGEVKFEKFQIPRNVEFVHVHGGIDGLVGLQLKKFMGSELRPSIILTLHSNDIYKEKTIAIEYLDQYNINVKESYPVLPPIGVSAVKIGLTSADSVTCTSASLNNELLYGAIEFKYRDKLIEFNEQELFLGIPFAVSDEFSLSNVGHGMGISRDETLGSFKLKAKQFLLKNQIIMDANIPLIIYIGDLDTKHGLDLFKYLPNLKFLQFNFLILPNLGIQADIPPINEMKFINNQNIKLMDIETAKTFGLMIRAASDFIFNPSTIVGYGFNIAEMKSFGTIPIASNVGGHKDLIDKSNGYLFNIENREYDTFLNMKKSFQEAIENWNKMSEKEKEKMRMKNSDSTIYWSSDNNPLMDYMNIYKHSQRHVSKTEKRENHFNNQYYSENYVKNALFDPKDSKSWISYFNGFQFVNENGIRLNSGEGKSGATQIVVLNQNYPRKVIIGGWSRAELVSGEADSNYAIIADIYFQDKSIAKNFFISYYPGTHGWENKYYTINFGKPIQNIVLSCVFQEHTGTVYFDRIYVIEEFERK